MRTSYLYAFLALAFGWPVADAGPDKAADRRPAAPADRDRAGNGQQDGAPALSCH